MSVATQSAPEIAAARYAALLRAANAVATCNDCDRAGERLAKELHQVVDFQCFELTLFDTAFDVDVWQFRELKGTIESISYPQASALSQTTALLAYEQVQPVVVSEWSNESRFPLEQPRMKDAGIASSYALPLRRGERSIGVLSFGSATPNAFPGDEVAFLAQVADHIALAIDAAINYCISQRAQEQLKVIIDLTNQVVSNLDFHELMQTISSNVRQVMRCEAAAIMLPEPDGKCLRVHALDFPESNGFFTQAVLVPIDGSMPGDSYRKSEPIVLNRIDPAEVPPEMYKKAQAEGLKSFCDVPLVSHGKTLGVLALGKRVENGFEQSELSFLAQVAQQVAIGVENALAFGEIAELKDKLAQEKLYLEGEIRGDMDFDGIVGRSSALRHVLNMVETVAPSDSTVLLLGETGTGKELIARAIHERSRRKERTFVKLNCAAIPTGLLESELFGHERGAFTGAITQKIGRLELSDEGTLFLDEVGDIPIEIQPKLLRALQEREFERLGSTRTKKVNVRLVAATNRDLEKMIEDREFRSDLYYRLNVFPIRIPPLRERPGDIPLLVRYFAQKYGRRMEKKIDSIPTESMKRLEAWHWPGNIRELENFIERSVILTHGTALQVPVGELSGDGRPVVTSAIRDEDREEILNVLKETRGRVSGPQGAAARMGLKRTTLISRMKKLGIDPRALA